MSKNEINDDLGPDPEIRSALRLVGGEPPLEEVDWDELRSSIRARAALPLARRRSRAVRGARWLRPLIPLAAAASVALAVWVGEGWFGAERSPAVRLGSAPDASMLEEALHADLTEQEFRLLVSGRADPEALLMIAAGER